MSFCDSNRWARLDPTLVDPCTRCDAPEGTMRANRVGLLGALTVGCVCGSPVVVAASSSAVRTRSCALMCRGTVRRPRARTASAKGRQSAGHQPRRRSRRSEDLSSHCTRWRIVALGWLPSSAPTSPTSGLLWWHAQWHLAGFWHATCLPLGQNSFRACRRWCLSYSVPHASEPLE